MVSLYQRNSNWGHYNRNIIITESYYIGCFCIFVTKIPDLTIQWMERHSQADEFYFMASQKAEQKDCCLFFSYFISPGLPALGWYHLWGRIGLPPSVHHLWKHSLLHPEIWPTKLLGGSPYTGVEMYGDSPLHLSVPTGSNGAALRNKQW